ncbi:MAG: ribosomal-protein-alanine N-acetyltransferase [Candidatus Hydrogenedentota bacterium]|nr:MAG: ribosomal-protein-alanine N-acetyltransferase [Candidatus Hydrogenedentota bacterium]
MSISFQARLTYEALREEHINLLMDIELEAYPEPWTRGMFRDEIRNTRSYFFLARRSKQLIGYAGFWLILDEAHITSVTVSQDHRGLGYGREQMYHLNQLAQDAGAKTITLEVRESNLPARKMYESMGFMPVGRRKGYYSRSGEDAIIMEADIFTLDSEG